MQAELIKDGVVKVDVSSIGTKFENFVQAGCRDLGSHGSRNVYCRKPIILPNLVLFFGTFLELPALPSITCGLYAFVWKMAAVLTLITLAYTEDSIVWGRELFRVY